MDLRNAAAQAALYGPPLDGDVALSSASAGNGPLGSMMLKPARPDEKAFAPFSASLMQSRILLAI